MPNTLAYLALMIWPAVAFVLFRRLTLQWALIVSLLAAYLVLPPVAVFDAPLLPAMDKFSIATLCASIGCVAALGLKALIPQSGTARLLLTLYIVSPLVTVAANGDAIPNGIITLPALRPYDAVSVLMMQSIAIMPLLLGRAVLRDAAAPGQILLALVVAVLAYSPLMLIEVRMSPQMNTWIYGFFQHSFAQMMRGGGFRPIVFLPHALWLAILTAWALISAATLARIGAPQDRTRWAVATAYLALMLVLCKSAASLLYGLAFVPLVLLTPPALLLRISGAIALVVVVYPTLRGAGLVPVDWLLSQAEAISGERAQSLGFRFMNETLLLDRANERPMFGWGLWGRGLLFDPFTGRSLVIADGMWVIVIGSFGWLGYIGLFGLLSLPILTLARRTQSLTALPDQRAAFTLAVLALLLAINLGDMLLNATLVPFTMLMAGCLLGRTEALAAGEVAPASATPDTAPPPPRAVWGAPPPLRPLMSA